MADTATQELLILRKYATGAALADITKELGVEHELTASVVSAVGFQRGRAQELVRQREAALVTRRPKPQPPAVEPRAPEIEVKVEPRTDGPRSLVESLLVQATAAGGRLGKKAKRIRALVAELEQELTGQREVIDAERRVQELRAQLEKASGKLRELRGTPAKPSAATRTGPIPAVVRAWAASAGVECGAIGRVPVSVMEKYHAAHPEAPRG